MNTEVLIELMKWQIGVLGGGIAILIGVVGYFAHKLVTTQEKHGDLLVEHAARLKEAEIRIRYIEAQR